MFYVYYNFVKLLTIVDIYKKFNKNFLEGSENGQVKEGENINISLEYSNRVGDKNRQKESCCK